MEIKEIMKYSAKPILKEAGFRTRGNDWWREIDGGVLLIHLFKSSYSNRSNGFMQKFIIFAVTQEEFDPDIGANWYGHHYSDVCLNVIDFLPYLGVFEPFTYTDYLEDFNFRPEQGTPEEMAENVRMILTEYVLPYLEKIHSMEDYRAVFKEVKGLTSEKDQKLLWFFYTKLNSGMFDMNMPSALDLYLKSGLTRAEVEENMWMLDRLYRENYMGRMLSEHEATVRDYIRRLLDKAEEARS